MSQFKAFIKFSATMVMNRQSVRIFSRLLAITGIILPTIGQNRSSLFIGLIRICINLLIIGTAISSVSAYIYQHRYTLSEYGLGLPYVGVGSTILIIYLTFIIMRQELDHLLGRIDQNMYTYSQEDQIQTDYPWFYRESSTKTVYFFVFSYEYLGIIPCIFPLIDHFLLKRTSFSFPLWMPWDEEEHFWATYSMQIILAAGMCWLIFIIQLFMVFGVIEFSRQNMRLCEALSSIERRSQKTVEAKMKSNVSATNAQFERDHQNLFDNEFQTHLKQCIQHHQKVVELFQIFKYWFSVLYSAELLVDSLTFAIIFYNLFQTNNSWVVYSALIGSTYIIITWLFTRCLVGEMFSDMNEKLATVIFYEIRWYEQSISNKRLLSIFHSQARRPMDLNAFSVFKASFFTFTSLIRTSYSYLNILKASSSSKN